MYGISSYTNLIATVPEDHSKTYSNFDTALFYVYFQHAKMRITGIEKSISMVVASEDRLSNTHCSWIKYTMTEDVVLVMFV